MWWDNTYQIGKAWRGKSVVLLGGAEVDRSMIQQGDKIVHCNNYHPYPVNGIYTAATYEPDLFSVYGAEFVCYDLLGGYAEAWGELCAEIGAVPLPYAGERYKGTTAQGLDLEWYNTLSAICQSKPLSGILAAVHLLSMPIAKFKITGFDFYETDLDGHLTLPYSVGPHLIEPQMELLASISALDFRVVLDAQLTRLFIPYCKHVFPIVVPVKTIGNKAFRVD